MRGSDPDAALYWLVTMLESGESPRFLARRLVILASEDVGLADPTGPGASPMPRHARSSSSGCPRRRLTLAHATIALALMPKSNSVTRALGAVTRRRPGRGSHRGARPPARLELPRRRAEQGFGTGYDYPHDFAGGWVAQQYLPDSLLGTQFFEPSDYGREQEIVEQWRARINLDDQDNPGPPVE